jgi:hypothetical protein
MGFSKVARALEDKRMDAYAKITHLNAQMNQEEQSRRRKEGTSRKNLYKEQLNSQLQEHQEEKRKTDQENNKWYNLEVKQMQR